MIDWLPFLFGAATFLLARLLPRRWSVVPFLFLLLLNIALLWHADVDDAFITYRYAQHLSGGQGLVFNTGERVEGFSNPLWVVILATIHRLFGANIVFTAKTLSSIFSLGTLLLLARLFRLFRISRLGEEGMLLFFSTSLTTIFWSVSGMETMFFVFLLTSAVFFLFHELFKDEPSTSGAHHFPWSGILFGLTAVTRPEGFMFIVLGGFWTGVMWLRRKHLSLGVWVAGALGPLLCVLAFRSWYYHALIPTTVIAKGTAYGKSLQAGSMYLLHWAESNMLLSILGSIGVFFACAIALHYRTWAHMKFAILASFLLGQAAFVLFVQGDWMPFGRFVFPVLPLLTILAGYSIGSLLDICRRVHIPIFVTESVLMLLLLVAFGKQIQTFPDDVRFASWRLPLSAGLLGECLQQHNVENETVSFEDIGLFSYYSGLPVVDSHGLIQRDIAEYNQKNFPGDSVEQRLGRSALILKRDPAYIIGVLYASNDAPPDIAKYRDEHLIPRYILPPDVAFTYVGATVAFPPQLFHVAKPAYYLVFRKTDHADDPRWKNCIDETNTRLGFDLSRTPSLVFPSRTQNTQWNDTLQARDIAYTLYRDTP